MLILRIIALLTFCATAVTAQQVGRARVMADSSAAQIIERLKAVGEGTSWVTPIMRQDVKPQPRAKLDALADGLADIVVATSAGGQSQRSLDAAEDALLTLVGAGRPGPNAYEGALDRLIRIHKATGSALHWLMAVPGSDRALVYLREVAVSDSKTAWVAISALKTEAESGGYAYNPQASRDQALNILRDLFQTNAVKEPIAAELLLVYGRARGWKRNLEGTGARALCASCL